MSTTLPADLSNYGPLAGLIGTWSGDKGTDIAPDPDGSEENAYYETIQFEGIGNVDNAEEQELYAVFYHLRVNRKGDDKLIHHQTGHWMWDAKAQVVMQSLNIPRGLCAMAGGGLTESGDAAVVLQVGAKLDDPEWGIIQSPFLRDKARTLEYSQTLKLHGDLLSYQETTLVEIYGKRFEHTDENVLTRQ
jgi:hypothetical protein